MQLIFRSLDSNVYIFEVQKSLLLGLLCPFTYCCFSLFCPQHTGF